MSFFQRLASLFGGKPAVDNRFMPIYVLSHRCREALAGQVDLLNDLSLADEGAAYFVRKVLHTTGRNRCFDQVEVQLWLDANKKLVNKEVSGGRWLELEEYEQLNKESNPDA